MQKTYFLVCFIISFASGEECWTPDGWPKNDEDCVKRYGEARGKYCHGRLDERGCEYEMGSCIPPLHEFFQDNDGNACPNTCEVEGCRRDLGEKPCLGPMVNGCRGQGFCQAETPRIDGNGNCIAMCPGDPSTCDAEKGEFLCKGEIDFSSGCQVEADYCASAEYNGPTNCPPICKPWLNYCRGENRRACDLGLDENDCPLGVYCGDMTCGGKFTRGCYFEDATHEGELVDRLKNIASAYECQIKCQEHEDCQWFVWKEKNKRCSLKKGDVAILISAWCGEKCKGKVAGPKTCTGHYSWPH